MVVMYSSYYWKLLHTEMRNSSKQCGGSELICGLRYLKAVSHKNPKNKIQNTKYLAKAKHVSKNYIIAFNVFLQQK